MYSGDRGTDTTPNGLAIAEAYNNQDEWVIENKPEKKEPIIKKSKYVMCKETGSIKHATKKRKLRRNR